MSITIYNDTALFIAPNPVSQILAIHKADQSISFGALSAKTFGDGAFTLTATASSGLTVRYSSSNDAIASINGTSVSINGAGMVSIIAYQTGNANYLMADSISQILTIHKLTQSIHFATLTQKTYGDARFVLMATSSAGLPVLFSASNTLVGIIGIKIDTLIMNGPGTVSISAYSIGNDTVFFAATTQILTIRKGNQSISFGSLDTKTYGDTPFLIKAASSSNLPALFSTSNTLVSISNGIVTINGAGTVSITIYNDTALFIAPNPVSQILAIHKADQSISFGALPLKTYGDGIFKISASSSSTLPLSFTSSNTALVNIVGNDSLQIYGSGTVIITASQPGNENYNPAIYVSKSFTILYKDIVNTQKIPQTMSFSLIPHLTVGQTIALTATTNSGLPVYFVSGNTKITITGNILRSDTAGVFTITAIQGGNIEYNPTTSTQNIVIYTITTPSKTNQIINFESIPNLTVGNTYIVQASASSSLPVTFTASNGNVSINGNTITALQSGYVSIKANQEGNDVYNPTTSTQNIFIYTITTPSKTNQIINFESIPNLTVGNTYIVQASASSSLPVTFTASNGNVSINGNTITALQSGYVSIKANQEGNDVYNPTTSTQNIVIYTITTPSKTNQIINFESIPNLTVGNTYIVQASASSSLPVTFTASNGNVSINGNTITALQSGYVSIKANQEGNDVYNPTTSTQNIFIYTITTPSKTNQIINFESIPNLTVGNTYIVQASASSSLPVTFTASNGNVSINGNTITALQSGYVSIKQIKKGMIYITPLPPLKI